jgi:flagellar basal body rod protein FlgB
VTEEKEGEGKLDQNRVDIDREITQVAENVLLHETTVTLLSRKLGGLRYAISEGRG